MNKYMKQLALFSVFHSCVILFCLLMIFLGLASPFINGFAVDAQENLYIGEGKTIRIYHDRALVGKIILKGTTYAFVVDSTNELIVAYPAAVHRMDAKGNILEIWEDPVAETFQKFRNAGKLATTPVGDEYRMIGKLGWTRIVKNGTTEVYRISGLSFVVKLLLLTCSVSLFFNGLWLIYRIRKKATAD